MTRVVMTMGVFDGLHPGHIGLLRKCRAIAGKRGTVLVGVNTDEFTESYKGVPPIFTTQERAVMLGACAYVDRVVINDGDDQPALIHLYLGLENDAFLVVGDDWAGKDYLGQIGAAGRPEFFAAEGVELLYVPRTGDWSTTEIRTRLA